MNLVVLKIVKKFVTRLDLNMYAYNLYHFDQ